MKTSVVWSDQVARFVQAQAPEPRRQLRRAIRGLAHSRGNCQPLVDDLTGYSRLRVGSYRVVFREDFQEGRRVIKCLFAERRNVVYELFAQMLLDDLV